MKKKYIKPVLFIFTFSLLITISHAQKLSVTGEKAKTDEQIETDCWAAHLDQDVNVVQKSFTEFIETTYKLKINKRQKNIYSVDKASIPEISQMRIDILAIFSPESNGSAIRFIFNPGYDIFLNNSSFQEDFAKAQNFVKNFVRFHYNTYYNEFINDIGTKIKSKESDIKNTESKLEKTKGAIADNDKKINDGDPNGQKLKDKNTKYYKEIEDKNSEIENLRKEILKLQDEIIKANESIKLVAEFK